MTKTLYDKIHEKHFRLIVAIFCLLGDLAVCRYLYLKFTAEETFSFIMRTVRLSIQQDPQLKGMQMPPNFHSEIYQLMVQTLILIFIIVVGFHVINYALYGFKKAYWSYIYIKFMAWMTAPGALLLALESFTHSPVLGGYLVLQAFLYFFVAKGLGHFQITRNREPRSGFSRASSK